MNNAAPYSMDAVEGKHCYHLGVLVLFLCQIKRQEK
jgi:hypothetical protein